MKHVFFDSEAVISLWKFFENPLRIQYISGFISSVLTQWWWKKPKNLVHKMILHIMSIFICYELWRCYTSCFGMVWSLVNTKWSPKFSGAPMLLWTGSFPLFSLIIIDIGTVSYSRDSNLFNLEMYIMKKAPTRKTKA